MCCSFKEFTAALNTKYITLYNPQIGLLFTAQAQTIIYSVSASRAGCRAIITLVCQAKVIQRQPLTFVYTPRSNHLGSQCCILRTSRSITQHNSQDSWSYINIIYVYIYIYIISILTNHQVLSCRIGDLYVICFKGKTFEIRDILQGVHSNQVRLATPRVNHHFPYQHSHVRPHSDMLMEKPDTNN